MEWISVKTSLPKHQTTVLAYREDDMWMLVCDYAFDDFLFIDSNDELIKAHAISHWMPLPPPPKQSNGTT